MRLGIFATHPIQYFSPVWRGLAATPGVEVIVHFFSDHSVRGGIDPGFKVNVSWDVPVLEGYEHRFLSRDADLGRPASVRMEDPARVLKEGRFDAVLFHGYTHGFERQVAREAPDLGMKTIMRGEFSDLPPFGGRGRMKSLARQVYLRWFYRHIDAFCYIGEDARRHLVRLGVPERKMFFSPYSVDTALLESQRRQFDRGAARRGLGIDDGQLALMFSGKLIPRKDPVLLVRALRHVTGLERISLIILGDGELKTQVEQEGRPLLGERLKMPGFVNQSQIGKYFAASDVLVMTSHHETWGLVVNEAMQFGLPVIVSDAVRCHVDLVPRERTGLVFPDGDERALARCIQKLSDDRQLADVMGRSAAELINGYSTAVSVRGIREALAYVAGQSRR
jgi:glycosyltransferase involved in cell wall biosynthesis